jgi:hypothetical protein
MSNQKGGSPVVDNCYGSVNFMVIGISWWLYGWRTHSYPAGRCHHRRGDPSNFLKSFQISVEIYKGTVQLSGFVNSKQAVDKAGEIVMSVKGVKSLKNNLIVK